MSSWSMLSKKPLISRSSTPWNPPTPLSGYPNRFNGRLSRSITVRVLMKMRLQKGFQELLDHHLCNAICHGWDSQRSHSSITLWYLDSTNRRRKIAPRGHTIPQLIEIIFQILFKVGYRLPIDACRSTICLYSLECLPNLLFGNLEWFCFVQKDPPISGCLHGKS